VDSTKFYDGQTCVVSSKGVRTCSITVDPAFPWQFYAAVGNKWVPGRDDLTQKGSTFGWDVAVSCAPFKIVPMANGYQFRIEANGTLAGSGDVNMDADGDGVTAAQGDCDPLNPSRRPKFSSETYTEVCGDGVDNDCSGSDLVCGSSSGSGSTGTVNLKFLMFDIPSGQNPLAFHRFTPSYTAPACTEVDAKDPQDGVTRRVEQCIVNSVDRTRELDFVIQAGDQWSTGYLNGGVNCNNRRRVYVYDAANNTAVAKYDTLSVTSGFPQLITDVYRSVNEGCHNILPKQ
jgi:hypothetical protein